MDNSSSQSMVDLWGVLTESKRIINAHSRHFLALAVLFLLPLSFSLTVSPTLLHAFTSSTSNHIQSLLRLSLSSTSSKTQPFHLHRYLHHLYNTKTLTFSLLFASFTLFFSLLAVAAVTFSVYHGFYGRPVKLFPAIRSLVRSFLPLLATFITAQIVVFVIVAIFGMFGYLGIKGFELIVGEVRVSYDSPYFVGVCSIGVVLLGFVLLNVCLNWALAGVIVVVEGKWGFEPLVRSKGLLRGMRWVALMLFSFFGVFGAVLLWISVVAGADEYSGSMSGGWSTWEFVLRIVVTVAVLTLLLLHSIAAITVLYMYCKALHGELAGEIAHEFAAEYVSLPFDEKKVPHVVCYVH